MGESNRTAKEIDLGNGLGDVAVEANGIHVELHADGSVAALISGPTTAHPPTNDTPDAWKREYVNNLALIAVGEGDNSALPPTAHRTQPAIGDVMPAGHKQAGWIYAGISKTTHEPFYAAPKDSGVFQWKEAMAFAAKDGSRLPSKDELNQLYDAQDKGALKGTFNLTGSTPAGWYWSSRDNNGIAWAQRFTDGKRNDNYKRYDSSLRCVR